MSASAVPEHRANGANLPVLGFGTWQLRDDHCTAMVERALAEGYRHIDTAIMYGNEEAVGAGLRNSGVARDDVFVTTKVWPDKVVDGTFEREVEASLSRLGLDRVDLLLIHWPPKNGTSVSEWMRLLNGAAERGQARHIGVSNFTIAMVDEAMAASDRPLACNQVEVHPYLDQTRMRATCDRHDMALVAYCPLFRGGDLFREGAVRDAAEAHGKSPAQIVLRWHVQKGGVAIPKTATPERVAENAAIFDFALSDAEMAALDGLQARNERICDYEFSPQWDLPDAA